MLKLKKLHLIAGYNYSSGLTNDLDFNSITRWELYTGLNNYMNVKRSSYDDACMINECLIGTWYTINQSYHNGVNMRARLFQ
jgi:hypothetical protein